MSWHLKEVHKPHHFNYMVDVIMGRISTSINEESCRIIHGLREFVNSKGGSYQNLMCQKPPLMAEIRQRFDDNAVFTWKALVIQRPIAKFL
jgi:hypothetical protein